MTGADPTGIAIVGLAALFPGAPDAATFWSNIVEGVDATGEVPPQRWDPVFFDPDAKGADAFYCRRGGFVDGLATFDPLAFAIMPNALEAIEPDQLLALGAADAALADAGNPLDDIDPSKVAVILGRGGYLGDGLARLDQRVRTATQLVEVLRSLVPGIDEGRLAQVKAEFQDRLGPERPESSIGLVPNLAASRIANRFDLQGAAYTVDAACASSLIAVDHGIGQLRSGQADLVLAGGVHHCHDLTLWSVFCQLRALSPTGVIRPFSADADGILVGEGTGIFVLKREADAERDGDRVYAVIRGSGVASDGAGASLMNPRPEGQVLAVRQAWRASTLDPATVGLIEAHGTATPVGDRTEVETLRRAFGDVGPTVGLGSVKSMIGHAMPAAGAAGMAKVALAIHHRVLPPTLHVETPNEALHQSRFRLLAEAEEWSGPRVAGVNAFGFGGINAHLVLTEPRSATRTTRSRSPIESSGPARADLPTTEAPESVEELLLLAGTDPADLLAQLDAWGPGTPPNPAAQGSARLAIVAPDERRLTLARKVLERGSPFRGRNDVWFEPNAGPDQGQIAFLYPGVEPVFEPRVDDVAERFALPWAGLADGVPALERQGRGLVQVGLLLTDALSRLGIRADVMAGHSLGEWTGQLASGMIPRSYLEDFLGQLRPGSIEVSDVAFLALGAGIEVAADLVAGLTGAYASHDNCPHQSVVCATAAVLPELTARAKARKVMAQELPFRSGFHSPLFAPQVASMADHFAHLPLVPSATPLWSATTVDRYPDQPEEIAALSRRHLVEPVRFRELILALHSSGARTFVQVGTGSLLGFVDDTLRDVDVLTVTANSARHPGLGQLLRVAAAVWTTGRTVDFSPLGHRTEGGTEEAAAPADLSAAPGAALPLRLGSQLVRDLTPLTLSVPDGPDPELQRDLGLPLATEFQAIGAEASAAALEVLRAARDRPQATARGPQRSSSSAGGPLDRAATATSVPALDATEHTPRRETRRRLSVADQPFWLDHAFYEQPADWPVLEDLFPLVPMTAIVEMLQHEAEALLPGHVAVRVEAIRAFRWLAVEPAAEVTIRAVVDGEPGPGEIAVKATVDRHARATVVVAPSYPAAPPSAAAAIEGEIPIPAHPDTLYQERHLFHGPAYQGLISFDRFGLDGVSGELETKPFPGSLLDNAGQMFGFWLAQRVDRDRLVLPTSIDSIAFYGPHPAPGTLVRCVVNVSQLGDETVRADLELTVAGQVWCRIEGWEDRRFQSDDRLFTALRKPATHLVAEPQVGGWTLVREGWPDSASRDVVMRRFLGAGERRDYEARNPNVQRSWLLGRIAAKDAVRALVGVPRFPVEVTVANDPEGRPLVAGPAVDGRDVRISIAHHGGVGVARAAEGVEVGIDIERIEVRPDSFRAAALSYDERIRFDSLPGIDAPGRRDRELTRWWAAKEAAGKAAGTGLQGRPHDWEVAETDRERLRIGDRWISTKVIDGDLMVAWTEG